MGRVRPREIASGSGQFFRRRGRMFLRARKEASRLDARTPRNVVGVGYWFVAGGVAAGGAGGAVVAGGVVGVAGVGLVIVLLLFDAVGFGPLGPVSLEYIL